jgi:hypothetical protein
MWMLLANQLLTMITIPGKSTFRLSYTHGNTMTSPASHFVQELIRGLRGAICFMR